MMNRHVSESSKRSVMNQKMTTPMIGPIWLPTPPMTTMNTTSAVHDSTLKASWLVTVELLRWISAPVAPVQNAAITHMSSLVRRTLTPRQRAPSSLSRAACRARPRRERRMSTTIGVAPTARASDTQ